MTAEIVLEKQVGAVFIVITVNNANLFDRVFRMMEPFQKAAGAILFILVLVCGVISTASLLLLASNLRIYSSNDTTIEVSA